MILVIDTEANTKISDKLRESVLAILTLNERNFTTIRVPSMLEVPAGINISSRKNFEGYIILGCILNSEIDKSHGIQILKFLTDSIIQFTISKNLLITQGIIIADTIEQAEKYCSINIKNNKNNKNDNYGEKAALTIIEMMKIKNALQ